MLRRRVQAAVLIATLALIHHTVAFPQENQQQQQQTQPLSQQTQQMLQQTVQALQSYVQEQQPQHPKELKPNTQQSQTSTGPGGQIIEMQSNDGQSVSLTGNGAQLGSELAGTALMSAKEMGGMVTIENQYGTAIGSPYGNNYSYSAQDQDGQVISLSHLSEKAAQDLAVQALNEAARSGTESVITNQNGTAVAKPSEAQKQRALQFLERSKMQLNMMNQKQEIPQTQFQLARSIVNLAAAQIYDLPPAPEPVAITSLSRVSSGNPQYWIYTGTFVVPPPNDTARVFTHWFIGASLVQGQIKQSTGPLSYQDGNWASGQTIQFNFAIAKYQADPSIGNEVRLCVGVANGPCQLSDNLLTLPLR